MQEVLQSHAHDIVVEQFYEFFRIVLVIPVPAQTNLPVVFFFHPYLDDGSGVMTRHIHRHPVEQIGTVNITNAAYRLGGGVRLLCLQREVRPNEPASRLKVVFHLDAEYYRLIDRNREDVAVTVDFHVLDVGQVVAIGMIA